MVFDYFSWARAKKNTEELEKTNPQNPVLKQDDEEFLERVTSQEPAQAEQPDVKAESKDSSPTQKRTWASYVPNVSVPSVTMPNVSMPNITMPNVSMPNAPSLPSLPAWASSSKSKPEGADAYPAGIKVSENVKLDPAKQEEDEKEVSVLLDKLNLSAINNRVFSFSKESEKLYENFTIVLKDMMNGVPTAYEDMEKLLKENDAQLRRLFKNMPPFVQTLVKTLPAKFGASLGPEILAAASNKPGADLRASELKVRSTSPNTSSKTKKKSSIPSVKQLVTQKGAVAGMLRSTVAFLQTRFPAFITGTNVIMSLSVFILLFVFWYCHKRGRETRLEREAGASAAGSADEEALSSEGDDGSSLEESVVLTPKEGEEEKSGGAGGIDAAADDVRRRLEEADMEKSKTAT